MLLYPLVVLLFYFFTFAFYKISPVAEYIIIHIPFVLLIRLVPFALEPFRIRLFII
jgi:hypothetical protein